MLMRQKGDDIMTEEWKDIEGYEGFYQISNLGRVKSLGGVEQQNGKKKSVPQALHMTVM